MRAAQGGGAGANIQHPLTSAVGYNLPSEPPPHYVWNGLSFGHTVADVRNRVVFVRSTFRFRRGWCYRHTGSFDPTRTLNARRAGSI